LLFLLLLDFFFFFLFFFFSSSLLSVCSANPAYNMQAVLGIRIRMLLPGSGSVSTSQGYGSGSRRNVSCDKKS
jgi:hypothetical protein